MTGGPTVVDHAVSNYRSGVWELLTHLATAVGDEVAAVLGAPREDVETKVFGQTGIATVTWCVADSTLEGSYASAMEHPWHLEGVGWGATLGELWARHPQGVPARTTSAEVLESTREHYMTLSAQRRVALRTLEDFVQGVVLETLGDTPDVTVVDPHGEHPKICWRMEGTYGAYHVDTGTWYLNGVWAGPDLRAHVAALRACATVGGGK